MRADYEDSEGLAPSHIACEAKIVSRKWVERSKRRRWDIFKTVSASLILILCFGGLLGVASWSVEIRLAILVILLHLLIGRFLKRIPTRRRQSR